MAGVSDMAFRIICKRFGADVLTTEMISSRGMYYKDKKTAELLAFGDKEHPIGVQIFGSEPDIMAHAAAEACGVRPDFIDINMGCPMPKIVNNGDGCALMKDPEKAGNIILAVAKASDVPVTVKFRSGYDSDCINAVDFAVRCAFCGASAVTVHARTRAQLYSGKADWQIIKNVKKAVDIYVYGNGDVFSPEDAVRMLEQTGCDGVAVGRGAMGNPFIFAQIREYINTGSYRKYSVKERLDVALEHIRLMCRFKGERIAVLESRKHLAWYMKGMPSSAEYKNKINAACDYKSIEQIVSEYTDRYADAE